MSSKTLLQRFNPFAPPDEAVEAGFHDYRPVSGIKPLIRMEPGFRSTWINEDLAPSPKPMRVWTSWSYVSLWFSMGYGAGGWSGGSSLIDIGLSFQQAMGAAAIGTLLSTILAVMAARVGAVYHVGYPAWSRSAYGMWGSKVMVAFRGCVAIIWYAVQTYYSSQLISVAFRAIFGNSWWNLPNHLPASAGITTRDMVAYFVMWAIQIPFNFVHPSAAKHIFSVKAILLPVSAFAFLGGMIRLNGGSVNFSIVNTTQATGSAYSWAWLTGINAIFGNISPMLINQPDIGRYSVRPGVALWPQFFTMLTTQFLIFFLGIIASSACHQLYGVATWNVWDICTLILDNHSTPGWRAGIAIFGLVQAFGTVALNLFANSIPFGVDAAGVLPKYLNIVRGQVFCLIVSWAICPWLILTSGAKFVTFLGSYTVFMASLLAVLLVDYYYVRRGNIHVPSLYACNGNSPDRDGLYFPKPNGFELKAFFAWFCGTIICIPGLAYSYTSSTSTASVAFKHIYNSGFLISFTVSAVVYGVLCTIWPREVLPKSHRDLKVTWEMLKETHGYFEGEKEVAFGRETDGAEDVETGTLTSSDSPVEEKNSMNDKTEGNVNVVEI